MVETSFTKLRKRTLPYIQVNQLVSFCLLKNNPLKKATKFTFWQRVRYFCKVNRITEHKPVHNSGTGAETVEFNSTKELLSIDFVNGHSRHPDFYRYSIHRSADIRIPLLAEYENGKKWIVIGFLEGDVNKIELPDWKRTGP